MAIAKRNTWTHQRRGGTLVETSIVITLLMILTLGLLEYGWLLLKSQQVTNATRQGARVGARVDAGAADIDQAIADAMSIAGLGGSGYTVVIDPADVESLDTGTLFTVSVSVAYTEVGLGMPLVPVPETISASVSMAREGL